MNRRKPKFRAELATYRAHRAAWIAAGWDRKWVAVKGPEYIGPYDVPGDSWRAAMEKWGAPGFLMRRVTRDEGPILMSPFCGPPTRRSR